MPLTDTRIRNAKPKPKPYKLSDGGGLYVLIMPSGARYWRMDYRFGGKRRTLALGVYPELPLAQARGRREEARASLARDADPSSVKKATQRVARLASVNTFEAVAREWLENRGTSLSTGYRVRILARLEAAHCCDRSPGLVGGVQESGGTWRARDGQAAAAGVWSSIPIRDCQRARQARSVCRPKRRAQVARPTARSQGDAAQRRSGLSECGRRL